MLFTILSFIKSKLGIRILLLLALSIALFTGYKYIFNKGVNYQKGIYQTEYVEKLNKILEEHKIAQDKAYIQGFELASKEQKIEYKYIERKVEVEKIVEKYKDCKMTDTDFNLYLKELRDLK